MTKPIDEVPMPPPQSDDHDRDTLTRDLESAIESEVNSLIALEAKAGDGRRAAATRVVTRLRSLVKLLG